MFLKDFEVFLNVNLYLVFDRSSQTKLKLRAKQRNKIINIYANIIKIKCPNTFMVMISFVLAWCIINEFKW